jgi:GT2 family glycosyltransferase
VTLIENKENLGYTDGNNVAMRYAMDHGPVLADILYADWETSSKDEACICLATHLT